MQSHLNKCLIISNSVGLWLHVIVGNCFRLRRLHRTVGERTRWLLWPLQGLTVKFFSTAPIRPAVQILTGDVFRGSQLYITFFFLSQYPYPHFSSECLSAQVQDKYPIIVTKWEINKGCWRDGKCCKSIKQRGEGLRGHLLGPEYSLPGLNYL